MQRFKMKQLEEWRTHPRRKPMIIRGARQVGKTWLMQEFGRTFYTKVAYINFDSNQHLNAVFQGDFNLTRILNALSIEANMVISPDDTLLIFDEIQEAPRALSSLKYFQESLPELAILAAGSLLGVAVHPQTSFPVGKVEFLDLFPLSFAEFLAASGNDALLTLLRACDFPLVTAFKDRYLDALKQYFFVGGLPEAVLAYIESNDYNEVRKVHHQLLRAYSQDFSKHAPQDISPRIMMLWESIPVQLAKENRKFIYSHIQKGARAREFETAIQWLADCGLVHKVYRVSKPGIPLKGFMDLSSFKLYSLDVGLLAAQSDLDAKTLLIGNRIFEEFKGALTEQYVLQQLISDADIHPFYWTAEASTGEVDFIFQNQGGIVPLEVKAAENLKAKSLRQYHLRYQPELSIRCSLSDYRRENWMTNLPLYALPALPEILINR